MTSPGRGQRVLLREWRTSDLDAFVEMNGDPVVMATIGPVMDSDASLAMLERIGRHFQDHGFGLWCVDVAGEAVGFCGLSRPWFRDGVEIGWRLRSAHWGQGYATEAAELVLEWAFDADGGDLDQVVSFTAATNHRSQAVMRRIGLEHVAAEDFDHPGLPEGSPLRPHVLYSMTRDRYRSRA